jgi:hypothetical protein
MAMHGLGPNKVLRAMRILLRVFSSMEGAILGAWRAQHFYWIVSSPSRCGILGVPQGSSFA